MSPVPLSPTLRYHPPGTRRIYWSPTLSSYRAPTRAELDAGVDLSAEIEAMTGFTVTTTAVTVTDIPSRYEAQVPGRLTMTDSTITCYLSHSSADVRSLLTRGQPGYIVTLWDGDAAGLSMDVWPVRVASLVFDTVIDDPGMVTVGFYGLGSPAILVPVPFTAQPVVVQHLLLDEALGSILDEAGGFIDDEGGP